LYSFEYGDVAKHSKLLSRVDVWNYHSCPSKEKCKLGITLSSFLIIADVIIINITQDTQTGV
jgi:hypothetical protein